MDWLPVNAPNKYFFYPLMVCGPHLWDGRPGWAEATWMGTDWYDENGKANGQWITASGVELNSDEVTHWIYPYPPYEIEEKTGLFK